MCYLLPPQAIDAAGDHSQSSSCLVLSVPLSDGKNKGRRTFLENDNSPFANDTTKGAGQAVDHNCRTRRGGQERDKDFSSCSPPPEIPIADNN